jgi:hypothetical protein
MKTGGTRFKDGWSEGAGDRTGQSENLGIFQESKRDKCDTGLIGRSREKENEESGKRRLRTLWWRGCPYKQVSTSRII